jgi:hypothetical protein
VEVLYTVGKDSDGQFVAYSTAADGDRQLLGKRPKYKIAQRLCEQTAGRSLDWKSLGGGNYEGR